MKEKKALVGMSGGVDSSVAAWLTAREGITCIGATMRMFGDVPGSGEDGAEDARAVAHRLGMPFHIIDMQTPFRREVMEDFVRSYESGRTPNPCIRCNQRLKFGAFLQQALSMGCDYVVTGHYARILRDNETGRYLLLKALDAAKDQSYFLAGLTQEQLSHTLFPLGSMTKEEARAIALEQGFINAKKRDSQDICFIPDGDYAAFLKRFTGKTYPEGDFLDLQGNIVGRHRGAVCYTTGQRKGLGLAMGQPVYVCGKNMAANTVTVGPNEALFRTTLRARDWNFIPFPALTGPLRVMAKVRSRMVEQPATVYPEEQGFARVVFDEPQRAITTGQAVVLYDGDLVVGSGTITEVL